MPRKARVSVGGICYHVINRGNARSVVFHKPTDYTAFVNLIGAACKRVPMRVLAYCLMPNHFHLALWPHGDGDLSRWMQWLLTTHVRRYHEHYRSNGHVWQGRFKAFPIQYDAHLVTVLRYIERNPVRAKLVTRAEQWRWSSLRWLGHPQHPHFLHEGPVPRGKEWMAQVNEPLTLAELAQVRECVNRGTPFGTTGWQEETASHLGLGSTLRGRGRPRKQPVESPWCTK